MATEVSPLNGTWPVNSSYNTIPVAYRSVRGSAAWPSICSGARYWTVPVTVPGAWLMRESAKARARPKSPTFGSPSEDRIRMFSGLMSRWTMPCACASSRAARTLVTTSTACAGWRLPSRIRMARRFGPRMNSMTMKYVPWVSPQSWTATMFGCDSMAAERASRRKRSMNPESSASEVCSIFSATSRSSTGSWARYTSPIPPAAMRARIWYRPSTVVSIITPRRGASLEAIVGADVGSGTEGGRISVMSEVQDYQRAFARIEREVEEGRRDLGALGFWRLVRQIKQDPALSHHWAEEVGRVDRAAFERRGRAPPPVGGGAGAP